MFKYVTNTYMENDCCHMFLVAFKTLTGKALRFNAEFIFFSSTPGNQPGDSTSNVTLPEQSQVTEKSEHHTSALTIKAKLSIIVKNLCQPLLKLLHRREVDDVLVADV